MLRTMLNRRSRATVTHTDLTMVGSVTIYADLRTTADLLEGEQVTSPTSTTRTRFTYAITSTLQRSDRGITAPQHISCIPVDLVV